MDMDRLREEINQIDAGIRQNVLRRMEVVKEIAEYKRANQLPIRDAGREQQVLNRVSAGLEEEDARDLRALYTLLMALSRDRQARMLRNGAPARPNVILIGMPGCGKTTVGALLAQRMGRPHRALDREAEERAGKTIAAIFEQEGEAAFRALETALITEACAGDGQVISTGGGAVLCEENRLALRRGGVVLWLTRPVELLAREGRPLSRDLPSLIRMEREREALYRACADARVSNTAGPESCAAEAERLYGAVLRLGRLEE